MRIISLCLWLIVGLLTLMIIGLILLGVLFGSNVLFPGLGIVVHVGVLIIPLIILDVLFIFLAIFLRRLYSRNNVS